VGDPSSPDVATPRRVRGEPIVARVLDATLQELARTGYAGLTLERVAVRAGVNRTTIYRRWPNKGELVRAAFQRTTGAMDFDWDTGSLRGDLEVFIGRAHATLVSPGMRAFLQTLLADEQPELLGLAAAAEAPKLAAVMAFFVRAEQRGEIRPELDRALFLDGLLGLLFVKLVVHREPVTPSFIGRVIDHVIAMVAPPVRPATVAAPTVRGRREAEQRTSTARKTRKTRKTSRGR
jgi:AcrR family transcriptional regulator